MDGRLACGKCQSERTYGDRINKVVFIGIEMDRAEIIASLDACLLTDEEMQGDWNSFEDVLPNSIMELEEACPLS